MQIIDIWILKFQYKLIKIVVLLITSPVFYCIRAMGITKNRILMKTTKNVIIMFSKHNLNL